MNYFYRAKTGQEETVVMEKYAQRMLDLMSDTEVDENHNKLDKKSRKDIVPAGNTIWGVYRQR